MKLLTTIFASLCIATSICDAGASPHARFVYVDAGLPRWIFDTSTHKWTTLGSDYESSVTFSDCATNQDFICLVGPNFLFAVPRDMPRSRIWSFGGRSFVALPDDSHRILGLEIKGFWIQDKTSDKPEKEPAIHSFYYSYERGLQEIAAYDHRLGPDVILFSQEACGYGAAPTCHDSLPSNQPLHPDALTRAGERQR